MNYTNFLQLKDLDHYSIPYNGQQDLIKDIGLKSQVSSDRYHKNAERIEVAEHIEVMGHSLLTGIYAILAVLITVVQLAVYFVVRLLKRLFLSSKIYYILIYPLAFVFTKSCDLQAWCYLDLQIGYSVSEIEAQEYYKKFSLARDFMIWDTFHK